MAHELRQRIVPVNIEEEMKASYIDYSMSVIVSRALPDLRDGLKPSHRRILVAMNDLKLTPNSSFRKCAKIAGDTSGNYHPHGEQVIYPTLVRMAQEFNMRYPLVEGQGNFGSIDGDAPAAMRYTEARLSPVAMEMLSDLEKDTVDFVPNYDNTREEPVVLPGKFPNLLCNGSSGIAVGMATNIPPHNLSEVIGGLVALIDDPQIEASALREYIQGPDFPTGGIITGSEGINQAYRTGKGKITLRGRASIERLKSGRVNLIISEIPYQVNKTHLLEDIARLARDKVVEGMSELRDESDREGMRIVVELKRDAQPEVILNQLYKHTQLQGTFGIILLCLSNGQPKVMSLKEMLSLFLAHRHEVITRKTKFELRKAEERAHILEGLKVAVENIDEVVAIIKGSRNPQIAKASLMKRFDLSDLQAQAILDMRLARLTGLEREKIEEEYLEKIKLIAKLKGILENRAQRMGIIKEELLELSKKYGDPRRTEIVVEEEEFKMEDLIAEEDMAITISHSGYIKRLPISSYRRQHRGGKGLLGMGTKEEDFVEHLFIACTHSWLFFFTSQGRCYGVKVYQLPTGGRLAKGRPIVNLLQVGKEEKIAASVAVSDFDPGKYVLLATMRGTIKKVELGDFAHPRRGGIRAASIDQDDQLIGAELTDGKAEVILGSRLGKAVRFPETKVRSMGRAARGVRGMQLGKDDWVVGMVVVRREADLLVVTENGFGKRTRISDYRVTNRGGKGIVSAKITAKNGPVVSIMEVVEQDELMLATVNGVIIRIKVGGIRRCGRASQGVKLINLAPGDKVTDVARVVAEG